MPMASTPTRTNRMLRDFNSETFESSEEEETKKMNRLRKWASKKKKQRSSSPSQSDSYVQAAGTTSTSGTAKNTANTSSVSTPNASSTRTDSSSEGPRMRGSARKREQRRASQSTPSKRKASGSTPYTPRVRKNSGTPRSIATMQSEAVSSGRRDSGRSNRSNDSRKSGGRSGGSRSKSGQYGRGTPRKSRSSDGRTRKSKSSKHSRSSDVHDGEEMISADELHEVQAKDLSISSTSLGTGAFAEVFRGTYLERPAAIKVLNVSLKDASKDTRRSFLREVQALKAANRVTDGVCKFYGWSVYKGRMTLIMKLYAGSLRREISASPRQHLSTKRTLAYSLDVAKTLSSLHSANIVVRDLKPENCLIEEDTDGYRRVVLADFGLARIIESSGLRTVAAGTTCFLAPEAFDKSALTTKCDIWSFGCLVIDMYTGAPPWDGMSQAQIVKKVAVKKRTPHVPSSMPSGLKDLLARCFKFHPEARPTADEVVAELRELV